MGKRKITLLLILCMIFFFISIESIAALNCSDTIEANQIYNLTENINLNESICLNITVENVTIDCAGFFILGNYTDNTYGIYSTQFNTTINNCTIDGFQYGIYFDSTSYSMIQNSNVTINMSKA